jgi:hypothetical protein
VRIGARGYVSRERQVRVPADGPPVTLSVALSRGTTVRGRVVLAGRDRSSGTVSFRAVHGETAGVVQWGSFGPDGHFEVAGLGPGRYRVDVGIAGGRPVATPEPVEVVAPAGGGEITIDLEAVAAAEIDVRIEVDGAPAPDFDRVRIRATDRVGRVTADRAASYPRLVVPPGTFTLTLSVPGLPEERRDVTVAAGDRRTVVFRLR